MATIHKFEEAGLGKSPFQFVGMQTASDRQMVQREREGNGLMFTTNYATSCDFCGTGIQNAFYLKSADGKEFKVGCECIRKSGDSGLVQIVNAEERKKRQDKAEAKRQAKWEREKNLLIAFRNGECESLRNQPHPKGREGTAFDYVEWCVSNNYYGAAILLMIEKAVAERDRLIDDAVSDHVTKFEERSEASWQAHDEAMEAALDHA